MYVFPEKIAASTLPTPILRLDRTSAALGVNLFVKRDDLTGFELSGNKVRKLEYIMKFVVDNGFNHVITCGGEQSNHCRATAAICAKLGVSCTVFISDPKPENFQSNLLLSKLFGAEIVFATSPEQFNDLGMEQMHKIAKISSGNGNKPYIIPIGASSPLGTFGYIEAVKEIHEWQIESGLHFDYIGAACGSGGTNAGLLIGLSAYKLHAKLLSVSVSSAHDATLKKIKNCAESHFSDFGGAKPDYSKVKVLDAYAGDGYAIPYASALELIAKVARTEGIIFDQTYTGKAFFGIHSEILSGNIPSGSNVLFIHTGGAFGIFHGTNF